MRKAILIATTVDRKDMFCDLMHSIIAQPQFDEWHVMTIVQGDYDRWLYEIKQQGLDTRIDYLIAQKTRIGPHDARLKLLNVDSDVYAIIDDDFIMLEQTNWAPMVKHALKQDCGFVSGNFIPHASWAHKKSLENRFIKQPIVYTAGGLIFTRKIAKLIKKIGNAPLWCDNTQWSLTAYLAGYENYRYLGSVCIHRVCRTGGRKGWIDSGTRLVYPDPQYIKYEKGKIPKSSGLTEKAKKKHHENSLLLVSR